MQSTLDILSIVFSRVLRTEVVGATSSDGLLVCTAPRLLGSRVVSVLDTVTPAQ